MYHSSSVWLDTVDASSRDQTRLTFRHLDILPLSVNEAIFSVYIHTYAIGYRNWIVSDT